MTANGIARYCPACAEWLPETRVNFYFHRGPDGVYRAHTYCKAHERERVRLNYRRRRALAGKPQRVKGVQKKLPTELLKFGLQC